MKNAKGKLIGRALPVVLTLAVVGGAGSPALAAQRAVPYSDGPDVPTIGAPAAVVTPFTDERWSYTEGSRTRTITVPTPPAPATGWDRIILVYSSRPDGDPWDRLYGVSIEGVQVLKGTTPRTAFSLRRDITEYSYLLPSGKRVRVSTSLGSWVGALLSSVSIEFYSGEPQVHAPAQVVVHGLSAGLGGNGSTAQGTVVFPDSAPLGASVDIYLSGHGQSGEFWYMDGGPPDFHLYVGETEIATLTAYPYVYALVGCDPNCDAEHQLLWWTGQKVLDQLGIHTGVGEIPPYRAVFTAPLDAATLALLKGTQSIKVVKTDRNILGDQGQYWPISVEFLLNGVTDNCMSVANPDQKDTDHNGIGDACDGPTLTNATGVQDGGPLSSGDVVTASYAKPVNACTRVSPAQFTYTDSNDNAIPASGIACPGGSSIQLTFPHWTIQPNDDGLLRYTKSARKKARLKVGGREAANGDSEPVSVSYSNRPFIVGAGAAADITQPDAVTVYYLKPVTCTGGAPSQFRYRTDTGTATAVGLACDGSSAVKVTFRDGVVDSKQPNPVIVYTASTTASKRIKDAGGLDAISPDEGRVSVSG